MDQIIIINSPDRNPLYLTATELRAAYEFTRQGYLETDFLSYMEETADENRLPLKAGQLEAIPEIMVWLINQFDKFFDANMSHNDLIELTVNHLRNMCYTPGFFQELMQLSDSPERQQIYSCASEALHMHMFQDCSCNGTRACAAARYLKGESDLRGFLAQISFTMAGKEMSR